jgi:hypothetical protein
MKPLDDLLTNAFFLAEAVRLRDDTIGQRFSLAIAKLVLAMRPDSPENFIRAIKAQDKGN